MEKCFEFATHEAREVLFQASEEDPNLPNLFFDPFGNYVFQKMLKFSDEDRFWRLIQIVADNKESLRNDKFGMKMINKIIQTYPESQTVLGVRRKTTAEYGNDYFPRDYSHHGNGRKNSFNVKRANKGRAFKEM